MKCLGEKRNMDRKECYICHRLIKDKKYYYIGQGKYRHRKCSPIDSKKDKKRKRFKKIK